MKNLLIRAIYLLVFISPQFSKAASGTYGADISWKKTGVDTYLVSLTVFRDCSGINLDDQIVTILDCTGKVVKNIASSKRVYGADITPVCKKSCSQCGTTLNTYPGNTSCKFQYGIEKFIYQQQVVFNSKNNPSKCCDFTLTWGGDSLITSIGRSASITTGASNETCFIEATLNRCDKYNTSSPFFTNSPLLIVCMDQCISYNPGCITYNVDTFGNRDSLVYTLYAPMKSITAKNSWMSPYNYYKPLKFDSFPNYNAMWNPPSCAGFHLDSLSGDLNFRAKARACTVIAFKVTAYGKDASGKVYKKSEIARDMQLTVIKCTINHYPTISGMDGTSKTDTNICAGHPFCFSIVTDDPDKNDTVFIDTSTYLTAYGASFTTQKKYPQHPSANFCWTPDTSFISNTPYQLTVNITDNACPLSGRVSKSFRIFVRPDFTDTMRTGAPKCGDVNFAAGPRKGSTIAFYKWYGDAGLYSTSAGFVHHYRKPGIYKYRLLVGNGYGCDHLDSGTVVIPDFIQVSLPVDSVVCPNSLISISPLINKSNPPYKYLWSTGDTSLAISALVTRDTTFYVSAGDSTCSGKDTMNVKIYPVSYPNLVLIGHDSLQSSLKALNYTWYRNNIKLLDTSVEIYMDSPGKYQLLILDSFGCTVYSPTYNFVRTGINSNTTFPDVKIYPNPSTGILTIEANGITNGQISILNLTGQVQFQSLINEKTALDLHALPKGIYLLKIQNREGIFFERVVLQ